MTDNLKNVWYLAVVMAVFAAGPRDTVVSAAMPDLCETVCGEAIDCNEQCLADSEPESFLITCADYDGGYENDWCNPYDCESICGDGICDNRFCGEMTTGATCCTTDCGSCSSSGSCEKDSDCSGGYVCTPGKVCRDPTPPEPAASPICGGECDDDSECCGGDVCRGHPLLGGKCVTPTDDTCSSAPSCSSSLWCNDKPGPDANVWACFAHEYGCFCSPSIDRCLFLTEPSCPAINSPNSSLTEALCAVPAREDRIAAGAS